MFGDLQRRTRNADREDLRFLFRSQGLRAGSLKVGGLQPRSLPRAKGAHKRLEAVIGIVGHSSSDPGTGLGMAMIHAWVAIRAPQRQAGPFG